MTSQTYATNILLSYAVSGVDNAIPFHPTGDDRHDIPTWYSITEKEHKRNKQTQMKKQRNIETNPKRTTLTKEKLSCLPSGNKCGRLKKNELEEQHHYIYTE